MSEAQWFTDARVFGAGSGFPHSGIGMSLTEIERRVSDSLRGAAAAVATAGVTSEAVRAAVHEAGHALVARALGQRVVEVVVEGDGRGHVLVDVDRTPPGWGPTERAATVMAGVIAERRWDPSTSLDGSEHDEDVLLRLMDQPDPPEIRRAAAIAEGILEDSQAELEEFVDALINLRQLSGDDVDELLGQLDEPESDEARAHAEFMQRMEMRIRNGVITARPASVTSGGRDETRELFGAGR